MKELITGLYFRTRDFESDGGPAGRTWLESFAGVEKKRLTLQDLRDSAGRQLRGFELQIDGLPDVNIRGLRNTKQQYLQQRDRFLEKRTSCESKLRNLEQLIAILKEKRGKLLRAQKKSGVVLAQLEVANDVQAILQRAYERITDEEVKEVSRRMNTMFLEMIGVDKDQGAIIRRAEVSEEFDIIVWGPHDRKLDPDRDLNGASRRALTVAFILALARVSEVDAPNVIDTPLGMTAGYVRHSMLRTAVRESSQLVLLLTHDEIAGCEEIVDDKCGVVYTLTQSGALSCDATARSEGGTGGCCQM